MSWLIGGLTLAAAGAVAAFLVTGNPHLIALCWVLIGAIAITCAADTAVIAWRKRRVS